MLIKTASDNRDDSAEDGIGVGLIGINEVDFGVAELIEWPAKGDEVFVEFEVTDEIVAIREDEGRLCNDGMILNQAMSLQS